jgi:hypothetical protein
VESALSQFFPADPSHLSAEAPGILTLGAPGIVIGDTVPPHDNNSAHTTCIEVNGGFVSVISDSNSTFNPTKADGFTIEAWVHVGWDETATAAQRSIIVSLDGANGYGLFASHVNTWQGFVATGGSLTFTDGADVRFNTTTHLVLTFATEPQGTFLRLFIDGKPATSRTADYQPAAPGSRLFIGAGGPHFAQPIQPWVGKIQCVAVYRGALSLEQVSKHSFNGNGHEAP